VPILEIRMDDMPSPKRCRRGSNNRNTDNGNMVRAQFMLERCTSN